MRCSARVGVLMGEAARVAYEGLLIERGIRHRVVELPGCPDIQKRAHSRQWRPFAFLEFTNSDVTRVVFVVAHPEDFGCKMNNPASNRAQRKGKIQEISATTRCYGLQ